MAKLFRIVIPVSNLQLGINFYSTVLGRTGKKVSAGRYYFDCDGDVLCVYNPRLDGDGFDYKPLSTPIYIAVSSIEEYRERAKKAKASDLSEIATQPWGERSFYMKDPFGNTVCFVDERTIFRGDIART